MKWFFGSGIAFVQLILFERESLIDLVDNQDMGSCSVSTVSILFAGYVVLQSMEMAMELSFLKLSEAALLNLSLLTSDLYATIFTIFTAEVFPSGSYLVALVLIIVGIGEYFISCCLFSHLLDQMILVTAYSSTIILNHARMQFYMKQAQAQLDILLHLTSK